MGKIVGDLILGIIILAVVFYFILIRSGIALKVGNKVDSEIKHIKDDINKEEK